MGLLSIVAHYLYTLHLRNSTPWTLKIHTLNPSPRLCLLLELNLALPQHDLALCLHHLGQHLQGLKFGVESSGLRVEDFGVWGLGFEVWGLGFGV